MVGSTETLTVCEPGRLEEDVMMGKMVIGVNAYREVCTLHLAGQVKKLLYTVKILGKLLCQSQNG